MAANSNWATSAVAEEGVGQHRLRVGVEGTAHGGRLLLRQSRRGVVGQVADVELVLVLVPEGHRRVAERSRGRMARFSWAICGDGPAADSAVPALGRLGPGAGGWGLGGSGRGGVGFGGSGLGVGGNGLGGSGLGGNAVRRPLVVAAWVAPAVVVWAAEASAPGRVRGLDKAPEPDRERALEHGPRGRRSGRLGGRGGGGGWQPTNRTTGQRGSAFAWLGPWVPGASLAAATIWPLSMGMEMPSSVVMVPPVTGRARRWPGDGGRAVLLENPGP